MLRHLNQFGGPDNVVETLNHLEHEILAGDLEGVLGRRNAAGGVVNALAVLELTSTLEDGLRDTEPGLGEMGYGDLGNGRKDARRPVDGNLGAGRQKLAAEEQSVVLVSVVAPLKAPIHRGFN